VRTNILDVAAEVAQRWPTRGFLVPANTGTTAREVHARFGPGFEYVALGNPTQSHEKGFVYHSGMAGATRAELEALGYRVVLQEVSAFQPAKDSPVFHEHAAAMEESYAEAAGERVEVTGTTLSWVVERTIQALHGEQVKTCVELALMAGALPDLERDAPYLAFCTPSRWSDARDCVVALTVSSPAEFFRSPPSIFEIAYSAPPAGPQDTSESS